MLCIVLYCAVACLHSTTPHTEDSKSVITSSLSYSATEIDFSIHTYQPGNAQVIKTPNGALVLGKNPFKNLMRQEDALQISGRGLIRYFLLSKNLIIRFSPVQIIFPFHCFW